MESRSCTILSGTLLVFDMDLFSMQSRSYRRSKHYQQQLLRRYLYYTEASATPSAHPNIGTNNKRHAPDTTLLPRSTVDPISSAQAIHSWLNGSSVMI